jgi:hypothetical protein
MKTFKSLIAEVAQPAAEDEINFKEKHVIDHILDPNAEEDQFSANKIKKFKNRADYAPGEDKEVYEANRQLKDIPYEDGRSDKRKSRKEIDLKTIIDEGLDYVGKEDSDIDNDGKLTKSDLFLHARRRAINKKLRKEGIDPLVPAGGEFDSDESHRKYKKSNITRNKKELDETSYIQEVSLKKLNAYRSVAFDDQLKSIDDDDIEKYSKRQKGRAVANDKISGFAKVKATRSNFESVQEAFIPGTLKLKDGASVTLNSQVTEVLNKMFSKLKPENKNKMESVLMSGKDGFDQIVSFAKEAV